MSHSGTEPHNSAAGTRLHPSFSRRIATSSPKLAFRLHAWAQQIADNAEQLERILHTLVTRIEIAKLAGVSDVKISSSERCILQAAALLSEVTKLLVGYTPENLQNLQGLSDAASLLSKALDLLNEAALDGVTAEKQ